MQYHMWLNNIENKEKLSAIFKEDIPSLNDVIVKELKLHYNGPLIEMRIELKDYPINPPKKWIINKYNKVDLVFQLIEVKFISITKWNNINLCDLCMSKENDELIIVSNGDCVFKLVANWIRIETISPFQSS